MGKENRTAALLLSSLVSLSIAAGFLPPCASPAWADNSTPKLMSCKPVLDKTGQGRDNQRAASPMLKAQVSLENRDASEADSIPGLFSALKTIDYDFLSGVQAPISTSKRVRQRAAFMACSMIGLQGFDPSIEGADTLLDEKTHDKSDISRQYMSLRTLDYKHREIVSSVLDLAMGISLPDGERAHAIVANALSALSENVGTSEANRILANLQASLNNSQMKVSAGKALLWTTQERESRLEQMISVMVENDPVVKSLRDRLHKYNGRSKGAQKSAKVFLTATNAATFVPTIVAPLSATAQAIFTAANGGPEHEKLLKEVYLGKCLEHRVEMIKEDAHNIVESYYLALASNNEVLMAACRSLLEEEVGRRDDVICLLFKGGTLDKNTEHVFQPAHKAVPEEESAFKPYVSEKSSFKPAM